MAQTDPVEDFYEKFYSTLKLLQKYRITERQFLGRLTRGWDFKTIILLDIGDDYGFSEWLRVRRTVKRRLWFETGDEGTTLPGIIFWVGFNNKDTLVVTKIKARGAVWRSAAYRRKIAQKTLAAVLKIVPPAPSG